MNIAIVGPGALGSLFTALLSRAGHELLLLDHRVERAALLAARGLWYRENGRAFHVPVRAGSDPAAVGQAGLVLLCVKSMAVGDSLRGLAPFLAPGSLLIGFQNGIHHLPQLETALPSGCAVGVTSLGATLLSPGQVRLGGRGEIEIGFLRSPGPPAVRQAERAARVLGEAVAPCRLVADILTPVWRKLLVNAGINALTALHDCPNGHLLEAPRLRARLEAAVMEAAAVAKAKGIALADDPLSQVVEICRATGGNISSMLQDIRCRRPTEIGAINGAVVEEADRLGLPAPVNAQLVRAIREKEGEYMKQP